MKKRWYEKTGLQFECQGCGGCCEGPGGYVWINEEEIQNIAQKLEISHEEFCKKYTRIVFNHLALIDNYRGDCIFLKDKRCQVYEQRPLQCRTFPWWPELICSKKSWDENKYKCPGINKGKVHPAAEIIGICNQNKLKEE